MRRRILAISLAIFEAIWLNIIVPGHQRGVIQVAGSKAAVQAACPFCCCGQSNHAGANGNKGDQSNDPKQPHGYCAICYFMAGLTVAPAVDLSLPPLGLAGAVLDSTARSMVNRQVLLPFDGRGPPVGV